MRRSFFAGLGLFAGTVAVIGGMGATTVAAKPPAKPTKVSCTATSYSLAYPQLSGSSLGTLQCSKPFGAGVQQSTVQTSIVGTTVSVTGTFKNFFNNGTERGTIKLSGALSSGAITATGPVKITGGTGAYRHITGTGRATCTTTDAGKTYNCTVTGRGTI